MKIFDLSISVINGETFGLHLNNKNKRSLDDKHLIQMEFHEAIKRQGLHVNATKAPGM